MKTRADLLTVVINGAIHILCDKHDYFIEVEQAPISTTFLIYKASQLTVPVMLVEVSIQAHRVRVFIDRTQEGKDIEEQRLLASNLVDFCNLAKEYIFLDNSN